MTTKSASAPIQLHYKETAHKVVVTPDNEDRFCTTVDSAIKACRAYNETTLFSKQFRDLLNYLANWISKNEDKIYKSFITIRDADLLFLIISKTRKYDRLFEDSLTQLDIDVAQNQDFHLIRLSVLNIPNTTTECTESFLYSNVAYLEYHHAQ